MVKGSGFYLCATSVAALGGILAGCGGGPTTAAPEAPTTAVPEVPLPSKLVLVDDLEFTCIQTGRELCEVAGQAVGNVLMIHGFPERKECWAGLMRKLAAKGYCGTACDMHGYSPKASPDEIGRYDFDSIRADTFKIAANLGYDKFHLVTQDYGAALGWRMVGDARENSEKILSFTSLSMPHLDVFSDAIFGENSSKWQQAASQYFTTYVLQDSATLHDNFWFNILKCSWGSCFETPADFQKALYWYNGLIARESNKPRLLAMPPVMTVAEINDTDFPGKASPLAARKAFGGDATSGNAQEEQVGAIDTPTLFLCGNTDTAFLCTMDWAKKTKDHCTSYTYKEFDCGHRLTDCAEKEVTEDVVASIVEHLESNKPKLVV